jgi:hypothetical protein
MPEAAPNVDIKPAGIGLAAAVLSLLICCGAVCLAGSIAALFLTRNPLVPRIATVRVILAGFDLLLLLFLLWCAWTVLGLFRLRSWARYSIIAIGALDFIVFALLGGTMFVARRSPVVIGMDAHPSPAMPFPLGSMILALAIIYAGIAIIGVWWVVYFNLRPVRLAFAQAQPSGSPPLGSPSRSVLPPV